MPADAGVPLVVGGRGSVWRRGRSGGSRTVATSTPVSVSVSQPSPRAARLRPVTGGGRSVPAGQQVQVDEHEQLVERVAAVDVAKASGMVCVRVPHATKAGKRITTVWQG